MNDMLYKLKIIKVISSKSSMYQATTKIKKKSTVCKLRGKGITFNLSDQTITDERKELRKYC